MYQIQSAQWGDQEHTVLLLEALDLDKDEESFVYVAREDDEAELNKILWHQAMADKDDILEDETTLILTGQKPLPQGHTIIGEQVYNDTEQAEMIRGKVREVLAELTSPESIARAELDEEYAAGRKEKLKGLLAVETQEGFPYNVDWSGLL
jgi:hypothetical protein